MKGYLSKIRVREEEELLSFMEKELNANLVRKLLSLKDKHDEKKRLPAFIKGYFFPLSENLGKEVFDVCKEVQANIGAEQINIEFYICNSPEINATSIFNQAEDVHFVVLNAGLVKKLKLEELKFAIGHEIGHLIFEHSLFHRVIQFIYPEYEDLPPLLQQLYDLWVKLSEISADRVGLLATRKLESAISAMFKITCGLNFPDFKLESFINLAERTLSEMAKKPIHIFHSHPAISARVKALHYFFESKTWQNFINREEIQEDKELDEKISQLTLLLKRRPENSIEHAELDFLASAGFLLARCDEKITNEEYDYLINLLSRYFYWPPSYLEKIISDENVLVEILKRSASFIAQNFPERTRKLYECLLPILFRDRELHEDEVELFLNIGVKELNIPFSEALNFLLEGIRNYYTPLY